MHDDGSSPRVPDQHARLGQTDRLHEASQVSHHRAKIIARVWLIALAVATLVYRHYAQSLFG